MILIRYKSPNLILRSLDAQGGHDIAKILDYNKIGKRKKKIMGGELFVDEDMLEILNTFIYKLSSEVKLDQSAKVFIDAYKREREMLKNASLVLEVYTIKTLITGPRVLEKKLKEICSFFLKAAVNTPKYKDGLWDGTISLYDKRKRTFPSGLLSKVSQLLVEENVKHEIKYMTERFPEKEYDFKIIDGIIPDEDQITAVKAAVTYGRGIIKAPTGWGKTAVFAKNLIADLGVPTIFIANKKQLLDDAASDFNSGIEGASCLTIKDGMFGNIKMSAPHTDEELKSAISAPIIVATIQSLQARLKDLSTRDILLDFMHNKCKLVIVDESQAVGTKIWDEVLDEIRAPYRIFLSATPRRTDGATLKLEAGSGPCIFTTTAEEQIEKGRLCELDITYNVFDHQLYNERDADLNYAENYNAFITCNEKRNKEAIVNPALEMIKDGRHVLVLVQAIDHGHILKQMFIESGLDPDNVRFVWGDTPNKLRKSALEAFRMGDFQVMIGSTIFDAGVNIPVISGVVLAGAGNSDITLIQRIGRGARNCEYEDTLGYLPEFMKLSDGKKITKVYDVMDENIKFFKKQAFNRYKNACDEFGKDRVHILGEASKIKRKSSVFADEMDALIAQGKFEGFFK